MTSLDKALSTQESDVQIRESTSIMKAFDITILNESHTWFLLQTFINKQLKKNSKLGYMNPHPQKNWQYRINVNSNDINEVKVTKLL